MGNNLLVSHAAGSPTVFGNGTCGLFPVISSDGTYIAFESQAVNLIAGQIDNPFSGGSDIFLFNRLTSTLSLVSHRKDSVLTAGNGVSSRPVLPAQGNAVIYVSVASDLMEGVTDANKTYDCYALTVENGKNELVTFRDSTSPSVMGGGSSTLIADPSVSRDGRFVVFNSESTNLIEGQVDQLFTQDVFLKDRVSGTVTLVSHRAGALTTAGNNRSSRGVISGDGRFVTFHSQATDLVSGFEAGIQSSFNSFVFDRLDGSIRLVSHSAQSQVEAANQGSFTEIISEDGSTVIFTSNSSNLIAGQLNTGNGDVYSYDVLTGTVALLSRTATNPLMGGNLPSSYPSVSADGKFVAFNSQATNLVSGLTVSTSVNDVFLVNRNQGSITLVSHTAGSPLTPAGAGAPRISTDGKYIVFASAAPNLVPGQISSNTSSDVFQYSVQTGESFLVSRAMGTTATDGNGNSGHACLSDNGEWVAFLSTATNLLNEQFSLSANKVYLFHRPTGVLKLVTHQPGQPLTPTHAREPISISGNGSAVSFESISSDLVSGFVSPQVGFSAYVYDRDTDSNFLVSHRRLLPTHAAIGQTNDTMISKDGSTVVFEQQSDDLVLGDYNLEPDVFAARLTGTPGPAVQQFYPVASTSGKTITLTGSNFIPGNTEVFFGGTNRIPGGVNVITPTLALVTVPPSASGNGNINGYLTLVANGVETTTQGIPAAAPNPALSTSTFPEFVLWGDLNGDGMMATNDVALMRGILTIQVVPTARQFLAGNVIPLNANGSRGDGNPLSTADFTFLRAVSFGQTQF